MKFYNREKELEVLNKAISNPNSAMIIISGRRRVGKSRLVEEFLKKNKGLKIFIVPKEEKQVAADFSAILADDFRPTFNTVKEALQYFFTKSNERILYIDEFPNFLEVNPSIPYEIQRLWDHYKDKTDKILIFSGSYTSMMDKIFTAHKAPLFNRALFNILLEPLNYRTVWEMQDELGIKNPIAKITNYCIFGGIPYYYVLLENYKHFSNVESLFFDVGPLREEGQNILRQEFGGGYKKYFSILEAIGASLVSSSEIANKMGITQTTLSKYLKRLQHDFKLIKREVPFGQNLRKSKKGMYYISDNLLSFWFTLVYDKIQPPTKAELNEFISRRFEFLCREFLINTISKNERILRYGRWWGSVEIEDGKFEQREIDLILETDNAIYIAECKWSDNKIGEKELRHLKESAKWLKSKKPIKWVLFNKSGFTIKKEKDVLLFDAKEIINH